ncbi:CoA ester lyase [Hwanghaeella grinnelliae]|uniref:CoA ester lyase n=1 Tax=Hwanghaeella grinnelliae TaxID=2500179 RepID=A0A437QW99_9PROT|nr:CoA ester lyase [Hwanghaeella grinnelliae]RVU38810.1 CoA ester lyase [Hwanghaeella grinnelliae]
MSPPSELVSKEPRPSHLCRSWLFVEGANQDALSTAPGSGADVLIQELEDFTPPSERPKARALAVETYAAWRAAGAVVAVRVNPLSRDGMDDLAAVMKGAPDIVALPKVHGHQYVMELDEAVTRFEREYGLPEGSTRLLPNVESAKGLMTLPAIAGASPRVVGCLIASEDLAADLGAERGMDGAELDYARARFLVECRAAEVVAVDCPFTFRDDDGAAAETLWARRRGYTAKSAVHHAHARIINDILTPSDEAVAQARIVKERFEEARARGEARVEVDGALVELPNYLNACRLITRHRDLTSVT